MLRNMKGESLREHVKEALHALGVLKLCEISIHFLHELSPKLKTETL